MLVHEMIYAFFFFFSSRRQHTRLTCDWSSDVCSSDLARYLNRMSEYPADWQAAAGETFSVAHVTAGELERLRERVLEVMAPYIRLDPASRPAGTLPVR